MEQTGLSRARAARRGGYTLLETVVVVALLALSASAALPALQAWVLRDRVEAATHDLLDSLAYARTQAQRLGRKVMLCRIGVDGRCASTATLCGSGAAARTNNWACGWLITFSPPGTSTPRVLRSYAPSLGLVVQSPPTALPFTPPVGQVLGSFRDFQIMPAQGVAAAAAPQWVRCVRIAAGGRARESVGPC
jgi:type IV fimbrial biogenesis protein FimT